MADNVTSQLINHIGNDQNFLLSGGAGSGKTHSLIQLLNHILTENPRAKIACITFTNVAADEIKERAPYQNLRVSTIHDFLWHTIKGYQKNLKSCFECLLNESEKYFKKPEDWTDNQLPQIEKIQYKEFYRFEEGIISHDQVLRLANTMFAAYPLLRKITSDKYDYIFIDEYQDTQKIVIEIFLDYLAEYQKPVIGLFGDSMQSIYDAGVGNIQTYVDSGTVKEVIKEDNNRCSVRVIKLLNNIRNDIQQEPTNNNIPGSATFIYSTSGQNSLDDLRSLALFNAWDFDNPDETKQLFLTHRLIAGEAGFRNLLEIYRGTYRNGSDRLLKPEKHDALLEHLYRIHKLIHAYETGNYNFFINRIDYTICRASDKKKLQDKIHRLIEAQQKTIGDVLNVADEIQLFRESDRFKYFKEDEDNEKVSLLEKVLSINYSEFSQVFQYINEFTPFSTQHNIKGDEFKNVFIALDNGGWNNYNFNYLFENTGKNSVRIRTKKIFYVCCSRAIENLVVYFVKPGDKALKTAEKWFGETHILEI